MIIFPGTPHMLPAYGVRKAWDYFVRNLAGGEPPGDWIGCDNRENNCLATDFTDVADKRPQKLFGGTARTAGAVIAVPPKVFVVAGAGG